MTTETNLEKLNRIASKETSGWMKKAELRKANESWLDFSLKIAVDVLEALRVKKMSQAELAALVGVTPQQINKIVKGQENLTLQTIFKLQAALNIGLLPALSKKNKYTYGTVRAGYSYGTVPGYPGNVRSRHQLVEMIRKALSVNQPSASATLVYKKSRCVTYKSEIKNQREGLAMAA